MSQRRASISGLALLMGVVGAFHIASDMEVFHSIDRTIAYGVVLKLRGPQTHGGQTVVVTINDRGVEKGASPPWNREQLAELLRAITAQQPRAIGINILFMGRTNPDADRALNDVLLQFKNIVVASSAISDVAPRIIDDDTSYGLKNYSVGNTDVRFSNDWSGEIRVTLSESLLGQSIRPFGIVLADFWNPNRSKDSGSAPSGKVANIYGPPGTFERLSGRDVVKALKPGALRDRIVIVGGADSMAGGLLGHATPFGILSDDEVHANITQTSIDGAWLAWSPIGGSIIALILGVATFIAGAAGRLLVVVPLALSAYLVLAILGLAFWCVFIPLSPALVGVAAGLILGKFFSTRLPSAA
jgi:CHASE2 domain-containing sensor protein